MIVVDGAKVWALQATYGLPLDFALAALAARDMIPAWDQLVAAARKDGANISRLLRTLDSHVGEAYPPAVAAEVRRRLPYLDTVMTTTSERKSL